MPLDSADAIIILLSLIGLADAVYVLFTQKTGKTLRCLIGKSCDIVTKSKYATTFGIDNSIAGIAYYAALIAAIAFIWLGVQIPWTLLFAASLVASYIATMSWPSTTTLGKP